MVHRSAVLGRRSARPEKHLALYLKVQDGEGSYVVVGKCLRCLAIVGDSDMLAYMDFHR